MRYTQTLISTLKEDPAEAEAISHKLMLRAGLIRKLSSGFYSYLPLGLRALQKAENIVRDEMNKAGAVEVLLPSIHPLELWQKTGRFELLGEDMYRLKDRSEKDFVLGPTHEEVITSLVADEIKSYKSLPINLYQIQTKFRDEPRPRFGIIRSREFIMKDAYSFDKDEQGLEKSYKKMYDAYCSIFKRCGLPYLAVEADPGFMGGNVSCEFMVLSESGEDIVAHCPKCGYAASMDKAEVARTANRELSLDFARDKQVEQKLPPLEEVDTPGVSTIEKVSEFLKVSPKNLIKTLIYIADDKPVAALVRGDHDLNETKLKRALGAANIAMADEKAIQKITGGPLGFSGPVGLKGVTIIADYSVENVANAVVGANKKDKHLLNVNINRDFKVDKSVDIRNITASDPCPKCAAPIKLDRAVELGHVFKLGTRYTKALKAEYLDEDGKQKPMIMGCYGIGINRILASAIETNSDKDGITWPKSISPYEVAILPLNIENDECKKAAEDIYETLTKKGFDVILDDRPERAGIKFKDADLIGFPIQLIIGKNFLKERKAEIQVRKTKEKLEIKENEIEIHLKKLLDNL